MSITCLLSHTYHDLRCPVCGEGFLILTDTPTAEGRREVRRTVGEALRSHHSTMGATEVHAVAPFAVAGQNSAAPQRMAEPLPFSVPEGIAA